MPVIDRKQLRENYTKKKFEKQKKILEKLQERKERILQKKEEQSSLENFKFILYDEFKEFTSKENFRTIEEARLQLLTEFVKKNGGRNWGFRGEIQKKISGGYILLEAYLRDRNPGGFIQYKPRENKEIYFEIAE